MQAAKQSLLSMRDTDLRLQLISQSVQDMLGGAKVGGIQQPQPHALHCFSCCAFCLA